MLQALLLQLATVQLGMSLGDVIERQGALDFQPRAREFLSIQKRGGVPPSTHAPAARTTAASAGTASRAGHGAHDAPSAHRSCSR